MDTEFDLIENLHLLSAEAINKPLDMLKSYTIGFIAEYYAISDFLDRDSFVYQTELLKVPENRINLILNNFDKAIATQCNNNIDLSDLNFTDIFSYSHRTISEEKAESKRYKIYNIIPNELGLFKKYWLLYFLADCTKIAWNIRDILNIPQPKREKTTDVLKLYDDTNKKEEELSQQTIQIFSSQQSRDLKLKEYYNTILPQSIGNTDNFFYWIEKMEEDFKSKLGYLDNEADSLSVIIKKNTIKYSDKFNDAYSKIQEGDKKLFLYNYDKAIKELKLKNKIENKNLSNYTKLLKKRIKILIIDCQKEIPSKAEKSKSKHQSFTYINNITGQTQLTDLMNALKRKNLINNSTDLKDFRKVFSGEAIDKPITWTGNISELSYFIKQLHNELKLVENLNQQQWVVTTNCFLQKNGKPFERSKFRGQKVPSTSKNIDSTLNTLK